MDNIEEVEEAWKDVPGYEGYYQVSDIGRVRSLDRYVLVNNKYNLFVRGVFMNPFKTPEGYYNVYLRKNKTGKHFAVHQLVAMCFLGHKRCGLKKVVDHINNNKLDNRLVNLQVVTNRQNGSKYKNNNTSKHVGVSWDKNRGKWMASIKINGATKNLGRFLFETDAAEAYQVALKAHLENGGS